MLRGVDRAAFVAALGNHLRTAGLPVAQSRLEAFARALDSSPPDGLSRLYWTARVTLVAQQHDLEVFDAVFAAVFDDAVLGVDPHARRDPAPAVAEDDDALGSVGPDASGESEPAGLPWVTLPAASASNDDEPSGLYLPERLPGQHAGLADTPFSDLDPVQLSLLCVWLEQSLRRWPTRLTRRQRLHHRGTSIALRQTLARSRRTGGEAIDLAHHRPVAHPRRIVMLCDVSQSMQAYATAYLHLMRAFARTSAAETFAFSTSLTRVTPALRHHSTERAMELATERVVDRYGGTRIATNVRALLASRHGNLVRGGIVVIASDGWDSDDPADLARAVARMQRRAYRLIWLNPRSAAPGFAPSVSSMAAALPYCDEFLPGNTIDALSDVVRAIVSSTR